RLRGAPCARGSLACRLRRLCLETGATRRSARRDQARTRPAAPKLTGCETFRIHCGIFRLTIALSPCFRSSTREIRTFRAAGFSEFSRFTTFRCGTPRALARAAADLCGVANGYPPHSQKEPVMIGMKLRVGIGACLAGLLAVPAVAEPARPVTFSNDVAPIF